MKMSNKAIMFLLLMTTLGCEPTPNPDVHPCILEADRLCRKYAYRTLCDDVNCIACVQIVVTECMRPQGKGTLND